MALNDLLSGENGKSDVKDFWSRASCGEELYLKGQEADAYREQASVRYRLEPYIKSFAEPERWAGRNVLEIGVGLGADHQLFAEAGAVLSGVDLTQRAIDHTALRFKSLGLVSDLRVSDAEHLPFADSTFDMIYSWGVIHHSPDTPAAAAEIMRTLKPGGTFKVMIYHRWSLVGYMLWLRYALGAGRPFRTLDDIYAHHLESPGTKAYSRKEAAALFRGADHLKVDVVLTHGDLLESEAGQRHKGPMLDLARRLWPRQLLRHIAKDHGLFLLIEGRKALTR